jgi:sulfur relay protein TusB/DsrH
MGGGFKMLFLVNKTHHDTFELISLLSADDEKDILLVGDGTFYAHPHTAQRLKDLDVDRIYVHKESLEDRAVILSSECEVVDYERIVDLVMEEYDKIITI